MVRAGQPGDVPWTGMFTGFVALATMSSVEDDEQYPYAIVERLRAAGLAWVTEGMVYGFLRGLEEKGRVRVRKERSPMGPPRRYYRLTADGRRQLDAGRQVLAAGLGAMGALGAVDEGDVR